MKQLSLSGLALILALPLLTAVRPAAAAQPSVAAQATGSTSPFAVLYTEDAKGTAVTSQTGGKVRDAFAGLPYVITSDGNLEIGAANGSALHLVASLQDVSNGKGLYYIVHGTLAANGGLLVNGRIMRDQNDPSKGDAFISLTIPEPDGGFESAWVHQPLTFAAPNPSPGPTPPPTRPF